MRANSPLMPTDPHVLKRSGFSVGGLSVSILGEHAGDVNLVPSLEPFRIKTENSDIKIRVEWVEGFEPKRGHDLFDSGSTWRLSGDEAEFQFDFSAPFLEGQSYKRLLVDESFSLATLQMSEEFFAKGGYEAAPLAYPLDELLIMHRLTKERAIELHGCGIVTADGAGNLFVGHSGAGKSTTTRLWTESEDVEILSDDRIIVREHLGHMRMYGTPWHGEAMFASPNSAPLTRIMVLEHGHGNVLTRLSPSQAVAELFARSFVPMHRHEYVESALEFLQDVAESVPCYRYSFEPDARAVEKILSLHE
ncbi:MAG: hypothetical protein WB729_02395 [Candidatus Sulfotelmatobacter sp.]